MKRRLLSILLVTVMLISMSSTFCLPAFAATESGTCGENLTWSLDIDSGVLTISGTGTMADYSSSSNAPWYSYRTSVKTVTIENGVTSIGDYAFRFCTSLTSITIPDGVTLIGGDAFYNCTSLTSITIPDSVTSIGDDAFSWCTSLTSITIGNGVTSIGGAAFYNCTSLTSITIPDGVTSIGNYAFFSCTSLTSITIPDSVTSIGSDAFSWCTSISNVYYNNTKTKFSKITIGKNNDCLTGATLHCEELEWSFDNSIGVLTISGKSEMDDYSGTVAPWSEHKQSIIKIVLENGVKSIGNSAFSDCTALTSITIPDSVLSIGYYAFSGCSALTDIYYNGSFESYLEIIIELGNAYFSNATVHFEEPLGICTDNVYWSFDTDSKTLKIFGTGDIPNYASSLKTPWYSYINEIETVIVDDGITSIGNYAFSNLTLLTSVTVGNSVTSIGNYAFSGCTSLTSAIIPDNTTSVGSNAFKNCSSLETVTLPSNITSIQSNVFRGCTALKSIIIPDKVTSIGSYAFYECTSLTSVEIPVGVKTIGNYAFRYCNKLSQVSIPDTVTSLGSGSFADCSKLENVTFPNKLTTVTAYSFYNCKGLTKIDIPASVTSIKNSAFLGVIASDINFAGTRDSWDKVSVGTDNTRLSFVACSDDVRTILDKATKGDAAWIFNEGRETVYFAGSNVGYIKSYTEANPMIPADIAAKVKYVDIDETMAGFGAYVFANMTNVISVTGGENIRYVGNYAFKGCTSLKTVEFTNAAHFGGISYGLFSDCTSLETIEISDSIAFFYGASFQRCTSLKSINVPARAGAVGEYAFRGCTSLETITLEEGVKSFGAGAIQNCSGLKTINFPSTLNAVGAYAFYSVPSTITVNFNATQAQWKTVYVKSGNATLNSLTVNCK